MATMEEIRANLRGIHQAAIQSGANPNQLPIGQMVDWIRSSGATPEQVAEATGGGFAQQQWTPEMVTAAMNQYPKQTMGLNPAMGTIQAGLGQSLGMIGDTQSQVSGLYDKGLGYLNPYMQPGTKANDLQAALSGAMGPEAQKQAFANYSASPGVEFAQKEAERALLRNASATGGLGGGNVLRDLTQLAAGTFMQDFGNQYSRLSEISNRGYGAATTGAGLQGQQAGVQAGLGQFAAGLPFNAAQINAGMQFQAGRDMANAVSGTSSALADLINKQGAGMTDITGNTTTNLNALYQAAASGDANAKEQLAAMLGNLSTGSASMVGGLPQTQYPQTNYLGQLGQVAGGVGGLMAGWEYANSNGTPNRTGMPPASIYNGGTTSPYSPYQAYDNVNPGLGYFGRVS